MACIFNNLQRQQFLWLINSKQPNHKGAGLRYD
jgi:hypothetical protein